MHPDVHERIEIVSSIVYHVLSRNVRAVSKKVYDRKVCFRKDEGRKTSAGTFREIERTDFPSRLSIIFSTGIFSGAPHLNAKNKRSIIKRSDDEMI